MQPDFLLIGAMKCATSTVSAYLENHPDVFMVPRCEPRFFSDDANWSRGASWYEALFDAEPDAALRGEGSNDYANLARFPKCAERIKSYRPDLKLIYMVRNPTKRLRSDWIQRRVDSGDVYPATIAAAIEQMPEIFVDQGMYWKNLSEYRRHFPDDQIFIGFMEDLPQDQDHFFPALTDFLGLQPHAPGGLHANPSGAKRVPTTSFSTVNQWSWMTTFKALLPSGFKAAIKDRFFSTDAKTIKMDERIKAQLRDLYARDSQNILEHCGRPTDFWDE